jgi:hypothetical protein
MKASRSVIPCSISLHRNDSRLGKRVPVSVKGQRPVKANHHHPPTKSPTTQQLSGSPASAPSLSSSTRACGRASNIHSTSLHTFDRPRPHPSIHLVTHCHSVCCSPSEHGVAAHLHSRPPSARPLRLVSRLVHIDPRAVRSHCALLLQLDARYHDARR